MGTHQRISLSAKLHSPSNSSLKGALRSCVVESSLRKQTEPCVSCGTVTGGAVPSIDDVNPGGEGLQPPSPLNRSTQKHTLLCVPSSVLRQAFYVSCETGPCSVVFVGFSISLSSSSRERPQALGNFRLVLSQVACHLRFLGVFGKAWFGVLRIRCLGSFQPRTRGWRFNPFG